MSTEPIVVVASVQVRSAKRKPAVSKLAFFAIVGVSTICVTPVIGVLVVVPAAATSTRPLLTAFVNARA